MQSGFRSSTAFSVNPLACCARLAVVALMAALAIESGAQSAPASAALADPLSALPGASIGLWTSLSKAQQHALSPLEKSWAELSDGQRRKWLAIAKTYPGLGPHEQEKLHSRMVEWATLSARDREWARLNFAQSKALNQTERAAHWEAYQALSPEDRKKFADGAKVKPVGAAVAVKPVSPEKLAPVAVSRNTPADESAAVISQRALDRSTLLPLLPAAPKDGTASGSVKP